METNILPDKKGLKLKFAGLYILSLALVGFIVSVIIPKNVPANITTAKSLEYTEVQGNDLLNSVNVLNRQYKKLKQLDQEHARKVIASAPASEMIIFNRTISETERSLRKTIDSLELLSTAYTDPKSASLLRSFTESFRSVMNDRISMKEFKTAVSGNSNNTTDQQAIFNLQNEIQARNSRITALEGQISSLENNKNTPAVKDPANTVDNRQSLAEFQAIISAQEKKIINLTAANTALEKDNRANADALEQTKKSVDNSSGTSKNQIAALEKRVTDLNAEVRFAQVDCNLSRVDITQIISNAKQRRALLAEALNTLNTLAATGDATVKKKVSEKITRLNQVTSTLRD